MSHFQQQPGEVYILIFILQMKSLRLRGLQSLARGHRDRNSRAGTQRHLCVRLHRFSFRATMPLRAAGLLTQPPLSVHTPSWAGEEWRRVSLWPFHPCCQGQREKKKKQNTLENYSLTSETNLHNHFLILIPQQPAPHFTPLPTYNTYPWLLFASLCCVSLMAFSPWAYLSTSPHLTLPALMSKWSHHSGMSTNSS